MNQVFKPWYAVATPHEDIREGRFAEAVFAANLWAVVQGTAPEIYLDTEEFFDKTYLTAGLSKVLNRVTEALSGGGDTGDRIISLQTVFGGGKTHTLVALWHLVKHADRLKSSSQADDIQKAVGTHLPQKATSVAVFTNQTCDATQGRITPDGIHLRTLWGELAYQLGGKTLYERVRANDETKGSPQGIFAEVLRAAAPCLILLDELADYCVGASAVPVGHANLADQTISFIQELTESAEQVPGAVVVATLPASKLEVAQSEKGQEAFAALERRFQRLGADVKPVADDEIYEVARARLFESIAPEGESNYPQKIAKAYQDMYAAHSGEVPTEATKYTYRQQIERAYPFHPSLIDALYTRWGSHPDLQRTRGVLRLLASIVGDLWKHRQGNTQIQHLIQPCHVRWSVDTVQASLTRLWGQQYQSVAAADIIGKRSNAGILDEERLGDYQREAIGEGLASAILLGSFGGQGSRSGFSSKDLKLACARVGLSWSYTDGALLELENRCFYLHTALAGSLGKRYWFGTKPTLNKLVVQYRQQSAQKDYSKDILQSIQAESQKGNPAGATWRIIVDPAEDLPEQKSLTLLIFPPSLAWNEKDRTKDVIKERVLSISTRCGRKDRLHRNTLLFLAGTARGINKLRQTHQNLAALEEVRKDYWDRLDEDQQYDLRERLDTAKEAAFQSLGPAYTVALRVREQEVESFSLPDARHNFQTHLGYVWTTLVEEEEWILRRAGSVTLENTGLIPKGGGLRLKDAIGAFLRFTDKPMIAAKAAITDGLTQACLDGLVGIGRGPSLSALQTRYCKQTVSLDPSEDGLWIIPPFDPKLEDVQRTEDTVRADDGAKVSNTVGGSDETIIEKDIPPMETVRRFVVQGEVPVENWAELFRCFVVPATKMNLKKLGLGVHFEMVLPEDSALNENDQKFKAMQESATQLGLTLKIRD